MAVTTTTTLGTLRLPAALDEMIEDELRPARVLRELMYQKDLAGVPSLSVDFQFWPTISAADLTEGTDMSNTTVTTTETTATVSEVGIRVDLTDLAAVSTLADVADFVPLVKRAVLQKEDSDFAALLAGFSVVVGTTGVDLTESVIMDADLNYVNANADDDRKVLVLAPIQYRDLLASVGTGFAPTTSASIDDAMQNMGNANGRAKMDFAGIPTYVTTNVPTANAGADRAGALFQAGDSLGVAWKFGVRTEFQRDASARLTEINAVEVYGEVERRDATGISIITDA